jgi:hypothetical protein
MQGRDGVASSMKFGKFRSGLSCEVGPQPQIIGNDLNDVADQLIARHNGRGYPAGSVGA